MKLIGKFLIWVMAYAIGAALIFFLARRPAPPINTPAPVSEAPVDPSLANAPAPPDEPAPPGEEATASPTPAADTTAQTSPPPRRVKSIRIPTR